MAEMLDLPLTFGAPDDTAIIDPRDHMRRHRREHRAGRVRLPRAGIITFWYMAGLLEQVRGLSGLREHAWFGRPLMDVGVRGQRVACAVLAAPGAPWAAALLEDLWALGLRRVVLVGGVGVLRDDMSRGSLIVPDVAIRDEGTSYHYLRPGVAARATPALRERLLGACAKQGVLAHQGQVWTTDGIYRETWRKVERYRAEGAICVDMEAAACFAVAAHRGVELAALFYAGDSVARLKWQPRRTARHLARASRDREKLLDIALDALLTRA